jgi:heat shock protein HtpX
MSASTLHKLRNLLHSVLLILGMALLVSLSAWALWGDEGVLWGLIAAALAMALTPSVPPSVVLSLYRARPLSRAELPAVYDGLDELARRAGLPATPRLYYLPSAMLNAFATGSRRAAAIGVTDGMLRNLNLRELLGVLAHEVSHIASGDLWILNMADAMSRATVLMSYVGLFLLALNLPLIALGLVAVPWLLVLVLLLAPSVMSLLQLALSRTREFDADLKAARLSGDPEGLSSALAKLELRQGRLWEGVLLPGRRVPDPSLLRTHPPTYERIRRLMQLRERRPVLAALRPAAAPVTLPGTWRPLSPGPRHRWTGLWY